MAGGVVNYPRLHTRFAELSAWARASTAARVFLFPN
jgi:hypothetical protein